MNIFIVLFLIVQCVAAVPVGGDAPILPANQAQIADDAISAIKNIFPTADMANAIQNWLANNTAGNQSPLSNQSKVILDQFSKFALIQISKVNFTASAADIQVVMNEMNILLVDVQGLLLGKAQRDPIAYMVAMAEKANVVFKSCMAMFGLRANTDRTMNLIRALGNGWIKWMINNFLKTNGF
jgi:hypothetical protein